MMILPKHSTTGCHSAAAYKI